ncbi:MAG TPA: hypothetical protein VEN81_03800 [Planctomycetota bacterium]|nr:hypothetical protein [Planctomycetota bacterium]
MPEVPPAPDGPVCRFCQKPVDWSNVRRDTREVHARVFECAYFCPYCRAVLEFASWQTGVTRKD